MNERDKIIEIIEHSRTCDVNNSCYECKYDRELENYKDMSCFTLRIADALIVNGIGDVAEWKERAEKERDEYRKLNQVAFRALEIIKTNIIRNLCGDFPKILQQAEREIEEEKKR